MAEQKLQASGQTDESGHVHPLGPADVLADIDLMSTEELWGNRRQLIRESGVRCGRPLVYPAAADDLPVLIRRRLETGAHRYHGVLFAFDLEGLPADQRYTAARFRVNLTDKHVIAVSLDCDKPPPMTSTLDVAWSRASWLQRLRATGGMRATASGSHCSEFGWSFEDASGGALEPRSYTVHALLEAPPDTNELAGALSIEAEISRTMFGYSTRHVASSRAAIRFAEPLLPERTGTASVRLCIAVDVEKYSRHHNDAAERTQERLVMVLERTLDQAQVNESHIDVQKQGDGRFIVLPTAIDEAQVIPALARGLRVALHEVNTDLSEQARIRLRVALDRGLVKPTANGYVGSAAIAVHRILDAAPTRAALRDHPRSDFALAVSNHLYTDVTAQGYGELDPQSFWHVTAELPDKGFSEPAWLYVPVP